MPEATFEWDPEKDEENRLRHGVPFELAQHAFADPSRVIAQDVTHSQNEDRFFVSDVRVRASSRCGSPIETG